MAQSLAPECTELKRQYDSCFNAWFAGYLEPAVAVPPEQRAEYSRAMSSEFEKRCGFVWRKYRACLQKSLKEKGLDSMLADAVKENPLDKSIPSDNEIE